MKGEVQNDITVHKQEYTYTPSNSRIHWTAKHTSSCPPHIGLSLATGNRWPGKGQLTVGANTESVQRSWTKTSSTSWDTGQLLTMARSSQMKGSCQRIEIGDWLQHGVQPGQPLNKRFLATQRQQVTQQGQPPNQGFLATQPRGHSEGSGEDSLAFTEWWLRGHPGKEHAGAEHTHRRNQQGTNYGERVQNEEQNISNNYLRKTKEALGTTDKVS